MPHRYVWKRVKDFFVHRVLHADDTPHRLALGVAVGIFVTWTPTIGLQMALAVMLAWLLKANKFVGVPVVWISNPLTLVPIYLPNYYIGRWILGSDVPPPDFSRVVKAVGGLEKVSAWWSVTWHALLPLWIGGVLVGLTLGALCYFATYQAVVIYRRKKHALRRQRIDLMHRRHAARTAGAAAARTETDPAAAEQEG